MPYSYLNLGAARTILAQRLQDTGLVFYSGGAGVGSTSELNSYIVLAVRSWQAYTASYRQRAVFNTQANVAWYDLKSVLSPACLTHSVTDAQIASLVLAMLLEPPLSATWTGSGMYAFAAIMSAIQSRLNRFLGDTGIGVSQSTLPWPAPPQDRLALPEGTLDVRRAAWISSSGGTYPLFRDDQWAMQSFAYNYPPQDPPLAWGLFTLPPLTMQAFPPPLVNGQVDLLTVPAGITVGTTPAAVTNAPVTLNVSDYLSWGVVFGALSDLLSNDGPARDTSRAQYCEHRYTEAVELARINPTVMLPQLGGVPLWAGSVYELDAFMNNWQSAPGAPQFLGLGGRTIAAVGPVPDGVYGMSVDVVSNIPVPASDADYLQVDEGNLDAVLDYAQHIALFKCGGSEFQTSMKLHQNFVAAASLENSRLRTSAVFNTPMTSAARSQSYEVPRV